MTIDEYKEQVRSVLIGCEYRQCDPLCTRNAIADALHFPDKAILLYQYRPCNEGTIKALSTGNILFKSPCSFNDPFDSLMYWEETQLSHYFNTEPYKSVLRKFLLPDAQSVARKISNCLRISCFSEIANSPLMWAHYADKGKGYCAIYELHPSFSETICLKTGNDCVPKDNCKDQKNGCLQRAECSLFPVLYGAERVDATKALSMEIEYMTAHELEQIDKIDLSQYDSLEPYKTALFKSNDWAYEHEWRLMLSGVMSNDPNQYIFPSKNMVGVVFGSNIEPQNQHDIIMALRKYKDYVQRPVELRHIEIDYQSKKYKFKVVNDMAI